MEVYNTLLPIKVAILGSCISRDNFNSQFNSNYSMFFKCVLHQHQSTFLSIMSDPIPFKEDSYTNTFRDFDKWVLRTECTKEFLPLLKERQPDYLLIDLYGDVYSGVHRLGENTFITDNPKYSRYQQIQSACEKLRIDTDTEAYMQLWKEKVNLFFEYLYEHNKSTKVILVRTRFNDKLADGRNLNEIRANLKLRTIDIHRINSLLDKMENYILDNYKIGSLDMTDKQYLIAPNHAWGPFYCHYTSDFYHDFFNKLQSIQIHDLQQEAQNYKKLQLLLQQTQENLSDAISINESLKNNIRQLDIQNNKLNRRIKFFENESFIHINKRYMLKNKTISKINNWLKALKAQRNTSS